MSAVNITAVDVLDNPTLFTNPMQFEIQYECLHELQHGARLLLANNTDTGSCCLAADTAAPVPGHNSLQQWSARQPAAA